MGPCLPSGESLGVEASEGKASEELPAALPSPRTQLLSDWQPLLPVRRTGQRQRRSQKQHPQVGGMETRKSAGFEL